MSSVPPDNPALNPALFDALTFDCYGTLIDWETGILEALRPLLAAHEMNVTDDTALLELYAQGEAEAEAGDYLPYREVLRRTLLFIAGRLGVAIAPDEEFVLADSVPDWPAFPDTVASLRRLGTRYRLAILSNIDDDLFSQTAERHLGGIGQFAVVVTAQQVRSYKPDRAHFAEGIQRLGLPPKRILHVAQSLYHDVPPARDLGTATAWVKRYEGRPGAALAGHATPDAAVPDLASLCDLLGA
jgi:2-haloacid dehalogenase